MPTSTASLKFVLSSFVALHKTELETDQQKAQRLAPNQAATPSNPQGRVPSPHTRTRGRQTDNCLSLVP
ncbi:MAG: hypothetical protein QOH80_1082 [Actinomycetota bacterium]|jgi:hypothetical protein|nr:hypothetical protein [Actinomycetota bacterium]